MDFTDAPPAAPPIRRERLAHRLPVALCVLFFLSGSSGLLYEVVWLRMLGQTLGNTVYATSTVLAVFMGGLALGSFVFGRFADHVRRPLVLYSLLEAGIGITALLSLGMTRWPLPVYRAIYHFAGDSRAALTFAQVCIAVAALLSPTALMGATLPSLCAYGIRRGSLAGRVSGTLYALNTLGAMVGVLAAGFILIGAVGETRTVIIGVAINITVALLAMALLPAYAAGESVPEDQDAPPFPMAADSSASRRVRRTVLICFGISGFASLAMEIVWSRLLALDLGTSIYAFSAMLVVMLAGIGIGGSIGGRVERWKDPLTALARLELGVACAIAVGLVTFVSMQDLPIFLPPLLIVGPAALLLGIAFPVAVRCYTDHAQILGRRVGELYAWNTVGCILGSLAGGFVLIPIFGTAHTGAISAGLMALASIALLTVHPKGLRRVQLKDVALFLVTIAAVADIHDPYREVIVGRFGAGAEIFDHAEEATATTTAAGDPKFPLSRALIINGVGMTTLWTGNKLMADLPIWLADRPHDVLVVCLGMGTAFRTATRHPNIDVTAVEIVPAVRRFMHFYHPDADRVMAQPNAHVVIDDGRNYLLMHPRKFDVITIDPAPPIYAAGTVNLYTQEFFRLCSDRIRPGGVVCLWLPPDQVSEEKMILHTYASVFPYISAWAGPGFPGFFLIGSHRPVPDVAARIRRGFDDPAVVADLNEWDHQVDTPGKVLALYVCGRDGLLNATGDAPIITDDHPYTEFPLWRINWRDPSAAPQLDALSLREWLAHHTRAIH
jgi:spermidine synthase